MAGISESHLSRLEKNREKGRPETWRKLAAVLEIDPDKLGGRAVIAD
jgi:transcriptional regulator with XRE-family HTH domain